MAEAVGCVWVLFFQNLFNNLQTTSRLYWLICFDSHEKILYLKGLFIRLSVPVSNRIYKSICLFSPTWSARWVGFTASQQFRECQESCRPQRSILKLTLKLSKYSVPHCIVRCDEPTDLYIRTNPTNLVLQAG